MMNTFYKKMRTAFWGVLLCAFLSGCGEKEELILIREEDIPPLETAAEAQAGTKVPAAENIQAAEAAAEGIQAAGGDSMETPAGSRTESLCVYVCGAVVSPGVVELPQGSRADDALQAAGGFAGGAKEDYVNLAARVEDGQMLYFPTVEEAEELMRQGELPSGETNEEKNALVNLNTADAAKLCTLPGIGEARAADIIAYREENGPFKTPEDIMKVPGIKTSAYEKLKDKITTR